MNFYRFFIAIFICHVWTNDITLTYFCGSIYRGYEAMLANEFLPLVLPMSVETREGPGLAVTDFRFASVPMDLLIRVHELVRAAVDRQATLRVEEVHVDDSEFQSLFGRFQHS